MTESDLVLPQSVADHLVGPRVLDPVDLDHHSPLLPHHVEDVAPERRTADDLAGGLGDTASPALACELELAEGADASQQVEQHGVQEQPALVATDAQHLLGDLRSAGQALLHGHGHHECGLLVAAGPERCPDRRHGRPAARYSVADHVIGRPSPGLPDVETTGPPDAGASRHRHADAWLVEVLQPRCFERGSAVQEPTRTRLEDRRPVLTGAREGPRGDRQALRADPPPPSSPYLRPYLRPGDPGVVQLDPRHHPALTAGDRSRPSASSPTCHPSAPASTSRHQPLRCLWRTPPAP